jgi:hypothetical protein
LFQRDYILRMVEQAAQAIARALGLMQDRKFEEASRELSAGYSALGLDRELIGILDAATFARQLGDDDRLAAAVQLLLCDAQLCAERSQHARMKSCLRLARGLFAHLTVPIPALQAELERAAQTLLNTGAP